MEKTVDSVDFEKCDIAVENFAEIGKISNEVKWKKNFSQLVQRFLHNLFFLCTVRIFCVFRSHFPPYYPQPFQKLLMS